MRPRDLGWLLLACLLLGCSRPDSGIAEASAHARPHVEGFAEFCRWARRAHEGRHSRRDRVALSETAFAPVRHAQDVLAAWLVPPDDRGEVSLPRATALPEVPWVAVRTKRFGTMHVAVYAHCPLDVPRWWRADAQGACTFMGADIDVAGDPVRVIVAYRDPEPRS